MRKNSLTSEYALILLFSRIHSNEVRRQESELLLGQPLQWDEIARVATHHQIFPFFFSSLKKLGLEGHVPAHIYSAARNYYYSNITRNLAVEKELLCILRAAKQQGIRIIPFRGFSLLYTLYRNPGLRIMSDIDLLGAENDSERIRTILSRCGWAPCLSAGTDFAKELSPDTTLAIDLHYALSPSRPRKISLPDVWKRTRTVIVNTEPITCLSEEDTLLSLVLHVRRHTRHLVLKSFVDIAELLNAPAETLDWRYVQAAARNNRIRHTVWLCLSLARELLDAGVPEKILREFKPGAIKTALLRVLINKKNFFTFKKNSGILLRCLLFDTFSDFILYLWSVSFKERLIDRNNSQE